MARGSLRKTVPIMKQARGLSRRLQLKEAEKDFTIIILRKEWRDLCVRPSVFCKDLVKVRSLEARRGLSKVESS